MVQSSKPRVFLFSVNTCLGKPQKVLEQFSGLRQKVKPANPQSERVDDVKATLIRDGGGGDDGGRGS